MAEASRDPDLEWLDHVQPVGLVVAPNLLKDLGLAPLRQTQADTAEVEELLDTDTDRPALPDPWAFVSRILGWDARQVAGSPGGPALPDDLAVALPEHGTTLAPTWAVAELGDPERPWQLLVRIEAAGVDPDKRGAVDGWEATPHQRFERLLRDTTVFAGVLITDRALRLVYAPRGETSGYLSFPLRPLATVAGRPMLAGLKLLLDSFRLFADADDRRLPALLQKSREAQAAVSTALAEQVLGALHELLRGLDAAEPALIRSLAQTRPGHLYEGLLAVLMRLVFILYAEDRDLLPSLTTPRARALYETGYAVRGLYAKLVEDAALHPDTMDERRGGWGRLLALFRLIYGGHASGFVRARGGKLFDPDEYPFLEGRVGRGDPPRVLNVADGCLLRILEGLMTLKLRGAERERLSYRTLDVEQIGSVYETVMGFTVEAAPARMLAIKAGKHNRTPIFLDLDALAAAKGTERLKTIKEAAGRQLSDAQGKPVKAAGTVDDLAAALDTLVDPRGSPRAAVTAAGTPILQPTDERRRTGSHYTPRSLTGPIVRHALQPAFDRLGPDATPAQILDLKVCDPAMGSGAFLVEACRAIGERLVAAWARWPETRPSIPADEDEELHARRLVAQRCLYGVDKNPRAVDLARLSLWLATLAKDHEFTFLDHALKSGDSLVGLSRAQMRAANWDEGEPGLPLLKGLIDERVEAALKGRAEIRDAPDDVARAIQEVRYRTVEQRLASARLIGDAVIAAFFSADKPRARERQRQRQEVESWLSGADTKAWERLAALAGTLGQTARASKAWMAGTSPAMTMGAEGALASSDATAVTSSPVTATSSPSAPKSSSVTPGPVPGVHDLHTGDGGPDDLRPFHWEIEFPEVFARDKPGFDAIVGNPPFAGKNTLAASNRKGFPLWLQTLHPGAHGNADLVAHFFRRAFGLLRDGGVFGLIATNTIGQGDTRATGLTAILGQGGSILRAVRRLKWPGEAAVVVSVVHVMKGTAAAPILDGRRVRRISAYLVEGDLDTTPSRLAANAGKAFEGTKVYGAGFTFDDAAAAKGVASSLAEMRRLIEKDKRNAQRIFAYIGGEEVNTDSQHRHHRYVINFEDFPLRRDDLGKTWADAASRHRQAWLRTGIVPLDYPEPVAADWPDLLAIVEAKVKPERERQNDDVARRLWWQFQRRRQKLYHNISGLKKVIVTSQISAHHCFAMPANSCILANRLTVFSSDHYQLFACLQSSVHYAWSREFGYTLEDRYGYSPEDCFQTFPFPEGFETDPALEAAGEAYHAHRAQVMIARNEGLTKTYNRFHDANETAADIATLRDLHAAMDVSVLRAYGWHDLAARAAPEFIEQHADEGKTAKTRFDWPAAFKDDLLARLLALNAARAEAERQAGLTAAPDENEELAEEEP